MSEYICLIVGASGSGKSTISRILQTDYGFKAVQSYTTRPPRSPEEEGHIFVSDEEFDKLQPVAYTKIGDYRYCATAKQIDMNDLYVIDPSGVYSMECYYHGEKTPIVFYIDAPKKVRRERMKKRGDSKKDIEFRLKHDKRPFKMFRNMAHRFELEYLSFIIDNSSDDINAPVAEILNIMGAFMELPCTTEEQANE